jgi:hypothetical protein
MSIELPEHYRQYIASLPARFASEPISAADIAEICEHEFLNDQTKIEAANAEVRSFTANWTPHPPEAHNWPDDYLVIGDSGCGDYYCISRSGSFPGVVAYEHEMASFTPFAPDFDAYYEAMMTDFRKRPASSVQSQ